jgi:ribonuclease E
VTTAAPIEAPVAVAAAVVVRPMEAEAIQPSPEPVVETRPEPVVTPVVAAAPQPLQIDLDAALRESGLMMVTTRADRVVSQVEAEETVAPRPRRERRPPPADLNAPLMQVETRKGEAETPPQ